MLFNDQLLLVIIILIISSSTLSQIQRTSALNKPPQPS